MHKMMGKVICLIGIVILPMFVNIGSTTKEKIRVEEKIETQEEAQTFMVHVMKENKEETIELETYLIGVVASEMPYTFELEALKAQAVAARTFVMQRGLYVDDSTSSQVYRSEQELLEIYQDNYDVMINKVTQAILETKGKVLQYEGEYISALFYSSNNGYSNDASWYYANEVPYLKSVDSHWDKNFSESVQSIEMSESEVCGKLGVSHASVGNVTTYDNGYIQSIQIGEQIFSGREVRERLGLRSSCFKIERNNGVWKITCYGYGHGVGMSQYGAQGMALEGYNYQDILQHYYHGVTITSLS